jgi:signal transduction histidine kinase
VTLSTNGEVSQIDTGKIAAIDTSDASDYATSLYHRNKTVGFIDCYRYRCVTTQDNSIMYIFVNCERELSTFHNFLIASVGISFIGLILVVLLVILLSKRIVRPVAESYEKQKRFITDASHEIKTPLTIIDANTEVIEMTAGESQWTQSTRKQIARLTALTEKLVFLSRMDEESTRLEMADFSISDAVIDTAEPFVALAASRGKTLSLEVEPDITFSGNEGTIRQLVSLLLDNAIKYSPEDGSICLNFHRRGKNVVLAVRNTVDNITPGRHDEFFERFYRSDASRNQKTGGHGIGLSVAHAIVMAHKGKISAKSEDGHSLSIHVTL